jgi:hypothetical protein
MPTCRFKASELRRCIEHAQNSTEWEMGYEDMPDEQYTALGMEPPTDRTPRGPCLLFVHDSGVYLMSNGIPRDLKENGSGSYAVYAEHCDPVKDEACWENSRDMVGGDDFVETIPIPHDWLEACEQFEAFEIVIENNTLDCGFANPIVPVNN